MRLSGYAAKKVILQLCGTFTVSYCAAKCKRSGQKRKTAAGKPTAAAELFLRELLLHCINADFLAGLAKAFKLHFAVNEREQRIVGTLADVVARMDVGTALLDKNVAGKHELTVGTFHTESLGFGITAVTGGTHTFFMREKLDVHFKHCCCTSEF